MPTQRTPLVHILTLNWNGMVDTLAFAAECRRQTYPNLRVLVVDNASTDGSMEALAAQFPEVERLYNPENWGFPRAMNVGLRHALQQGADYVFVANNDTLLAPDMVALLVGAAQRYKADMTGPAIYYASEPDRLWWLAGHRLPVLMELSFEQVPGDELPFEADFVTGCGMLISRQCLETVGLFDERFFIYHEDNDYCLQVREAGLRVMAVPQAKMWHKVSTAMGGSYSYRERYQYGRSTALFFRKHTQGLQWLAVLPFRIGSALKCTFRLLRLGRPQVVRAYWQGLWDGARARV
jgi:hypothetical protein